MIDADHFKQVNDQEGHSIGDVVLRILAGRLGGAVGDDDTLVRWGGEEFVVLIPEATDAQVERLGEQLRAAIGASAFVISETRSLAVTVSVGCSVGSLDAVEDVLEAADQALYDAKSQGRNCVASRAA